MQAQDMNLPNNSNCGSDVVASPVRMRPSKEQLERLSKDEIIKQFLDFDGHSSQDCQHCSRKSASAGDLLVGDDHFRQQQIEAARRDSVLVMRLATKESEVQDYATQVEELKAGAIGSLKTAMLDPAVNLLFQRMRQEISTIKEKLEQSQQELNAWKFTPESNTGKRLMARCRLLLAENEELEKMITSGRVGKIEGELVVSRTFNDELKKSQTEVDDLMVEVDEELEGLQATIYYLRTQLKALRAENDSLRGLLAKNGIAVDASTVPAMLEDADAPGAAGSSMSGERHHRRRTSSTNEEVNAVAADDEEMNSANESEDRSDVDEAGSNAGDDDSSVMIDEYNSGRGATGDEDDCIVLEQNGRCDGGENEEGEPPRKRKAVAAIFEEYDPGPAVLVVAPVVAEVAATRSESNRSTPVSNERTDDVVDEYDGAYRTAGVGASTGEVVTAGVVVEEPPTLTTKQQIQQAAAVYTLPLELEAEDEESRSDETDTEEGEPPPPPRTQTQKRTTAERAKQQAYALRNGVTTEPAPKRGRPPLAAKEMDVRILQQQPTAEARSHRRGGHDAARRETYPRLTTVATKDVQAKV